MESYQRGSFNFEVSDHGPADGRVVIALHGFPEDRHCWDELAGHLTGAGYRVLAPDQRGYSPGARPAGRRSYAIDQLTGDVLALADAAGARRFDVIGHDWGGGVAWDIAAKHPDRVRSLVALSTPHPRAFRDSLVHSSQLAHSWYMLFFQIPRLPEAAMRRAGPERAAKQLTADGLDEVTAGRYAARMAQPGAMTGPVNWYRGLPFGARQPTPAVKVPTLYVWSDGDRYLTRWAAERTASYVEGPYRFEALAGYSHWLPTTASGKLAPVVLEHLASAGD